MPQKEKHKKATAEEALRSLWAQVRAENPDWPKERQRAFVRAGMRAQGWKY